MKEKKITKEKIKHCLKIILQFILNPRFIVCFGIGWMITNGWSYIMFAVGTLLDIEWMIIVSSAYLAFLWLPISPEKLVTLAIAIVLLKFLFPNDKKTLGILQELHCKMKEKVMNRKSKKRKHNQEQKTNKEKEA